MAECRYNLRNTKKKPQAVLLKRWEVEYSKLVKDKNRRIPLETIRSVIRSAFGDSGIEQWRITLKCPLSQQQIRVPARYVDCTHIECFDLKTFLQMKMQKNFLVCPICQKQVEKPMANLRIDEYIETVLSELPDAIQVELMPDGTFTHVQELIIARHVIDDEEPFVQDNNAPATNKDPKQEVKQEEDDDTYITLSDGEDEFMEEVSIVDKKPIYLIPLNMDIKPNISSEPELSHPREEQETQDIVLLKDQDKEVALNNMMEQWQQISSVDSSQKQIITKLFIVISEGIVCYETIDHRVYEYAPLRDYLAILRESVLSTNGCEVVIQFYACDTYIPYKYRKTSEQPKQEFTSMEQLKTFAQHFHSIAFLWAGDTVTAHFGCFKKKRNKMPSQLDYCSELFSRDRSILKCKKLDVTLVDNWPLSIVTNVVDRCDKCELRLEEMLPGNLELHDAFLEEIYERDLIQKIAVTLCIPDVETVNDFIDKLKKRFRRAPQKCFKFELFAYSKQVDKLSLKTQDCILKARTSILHNYLESVIIEQSAIGS